MKFLIRFITFCSLVFAGNENKDGFVFEVYNYVGTKEDEPIPPVYCYNKNVKENDDGELQWQDNNQEKYAVILKSIENANAKEKKSLQDLRKDIIKRDLFAMYTTPNMVIAFQTYFVPYKETKEETELIDFRNRYYKSQTINREFIARCLGYEIYHKNETFLPGESNENRQDIEDYANNFRCILMEHKEKYDKMKGKLAEFEEQGHTIYKMVKNQWEILQQKSEIYHIFCISVDQLFEGLQKIRPSWFKKDKWDEEINTLKDLYKIDREEICGMGSSLSSFIQGEMEKAKREVEKYEKEREKYEKEKEERDQAGQEVEEIEVFVEKKKEEYEKIDALILEKEALWVAAKNINDYFKKFKSAAQDLIEDQKKIQGLQEEKEKIKQEIEIFSIIKEKQKDLEIKKKEEQETSEKRINELKEIEKKIEAMQDELKKIEQKKEEDKTQEEKEDASTLKLKIIALGRKMSEKITEYIQEDIKKIEEEIKDLEKKTKDNSLNQVIGVSPLSWWEDKKKKEKKILDEVSSCKDIKDMLPNGLNLLSKNFMEIKEKEEKIKIHTQTEQLAKRLLVEKREKKQILEKKIAEKNNAKQIKINDYIYAERSQSLFLSEKKENKEKISCFLILQEELFKKYLEQKELLAQAERIKEQIKFNITQHSRFLQDNIFEKNKQCRQVFEIIDNNKQEQQQVSDNNGIEQINTSSNLNIIPHSPENNEKEKCQQILLLIKEMEILMTESEVNFFVANFIDDRENPKDQSEIENSKSLVLSNKTYLEQEPIIKQYIESQKNIEGISKNQEENKLDQELENLKKFVIEQWKGGLDLDQEEIEKKVKGPLSLQEFIDIIDNVNKDNKENQNFKDLIINQTKELLKKTGIFTSQTSEKKLSFLKEYIRLEKNIIEHKSKLNVEKSRLINLINFNQLEDEEIYNQIINKDQIMNEENLYKNFKNWDKDVSEGKIREIEKKILSFKKELTNDNLEISSVRKQLFREKEKEETLKSILEEEQWSQLYISGEKQFLDSKQELSKQLLDSEWELIKNWQEKYLKFLSLQEYELKNLASQRTEIVKSLKNYNTFSGDLDEKYDRRILFYKEKLEILKNFEEDFMKKSSMYMYGPLVKPEMDYRDPFEQYSPSPKNYFLFRITVIITMDNTDSSYKNLLEAWSMGLQSPYTYMGSPSLFWVDHEKILRDKKMLSQFSQDIQDFAGQERFIVQLQLNRISKCIDHLATMDFFKNDNFFRDKESYRKDKESYRPCHYIIDACDFFFQSLMGDPYFNFEDHFVDKFQILVIHCPLRWYYSRIQCNNNKHMKLEFFLRGNNNNNENKVFFQDFKKVLQFSMIKNDENQNVNNKTGRYSLEQTNGVPYSYVKNKLFFYENAENSTTTISAQAYSARLLSPNRLSDFKKISICHKIDHQKTVQTFKKYSYIPLYANNCKREKKMRKFKESLKTILVKEKLKEERQKTFCQDLKKDYYENKEKTNDSLKRLQNNIGMLNNTEKLIQQSLEERDKNSSEMQKDIQIIKEEKILDSNIFGIFVCFILLVLGILIYLINKKIDLQELIHEVLNENFPDKQQESHLAT